MFPLREAATSCAFVLVSDARYAREQNGSGTGILDVHLSSLLEDT